MSVPPVPPPARSGSAQAVDAASLRHIRSLFQRKMLDRAVALADSRWPGSGEMVKLANEWSALSPADRRARLSQIGPEDLARLRALADLNPDLARVLDDLEERGVLPPTLYTGEAGAATQEDLVDAALNLGEEAVVHAAERADDPATVAAAAAAAAALAKTLPRLTLLPQVEMPNLDLGLPSTDEFLDAETQRRVAAATAAQEVLERVRQRVDRSAARLTRSTADGSGTTAPADIQGPTIPLTPLVVSTAAGDSEMPIAAATVPPLARELTARLQAEQLIVLDEFEATPSNQDIMSISQALRMPRVEFTLIAGESRAIFGGLRRRGPEVRVEAGPLPRAMAAGNLVVVRGSIYPKMVTRWREGFCDIPGTKASTRISPDCRILVLADAG